MNIRLGVEIVSTEHHLVVEIADVEEITRDVFVKVRSRKTRPCSTTAPDAADGIPCQILAITGEIEQGIRGELHGSGLEGHAGLLHDIDSSGIDVIVGRVERDWVRCGGMSVGKTDTSASGVDDPVEEGLAYQCAVQLW